MTICRSNKNIADEIIFLKKQGLLSLVLKTGWFNGCCTRIAMQNPIFSQEKENE